MEFNNSINCIYNRKSEPEMKLKIECNKHKIHAEKNNCPIPSKWIPIKWIAILSLYASHIFNLSINERLSTVLEFIYSHGIFIAQIFHIAHIHTLVVNK